jgi:AcrR family transcriptional regulator
MRTPADTGGSAAGTSPADPLAGISLRERKRARLRVGLWSALRTRIERTPFAEITVRELAADLEISEPTFFAHFAGKSELLAYHIGLWRIDTTLAARAGTDGIGFVYRFFEHTAHTIREGPRMWFEITAEVARGGGVCAPVDIGPAERLLVFGDRAALDVPARSQADLFADHLTAAAAAGSLGGSVLAAATALLTGFYGVPLALGPGRLTELSAAYRAHLDHVLAGTRT